MQPETLTLRTLLLARRLASGARVVAPVADLRLAAHGAEVDAVAEVEVFLGEHLSREAPERVATFNLPEGVTLETVKVPFPREDLPRRLQPELSVDVHCVVIPDGEARWVIVPPVDHVLRVDPGEDLHEAVAAEVTRLVGALEWSAWQRLSLLPPRATTLLEREVEVARGERLPADRATSLRKAIRDRERARRALEVLSSVGSPAHERVPASPPPLASRDGELKRLDALMTAKQRAAVMLVGDALSGKSALVEAWVHLQRGREGAARVFMTSGAQLIAGMSGLGQWEERVRRVMQAAEDTDAVLWFDDLGDLLTDHPGGVDIPSALKPWIEEGRVRVIAELRADLVDLAERRHGGFVGCFSRMRVEPLTAAQSREALTSRLDWSRHEEPDRATLEPRAVDALVDLAERYLPYQAFPGKLLRLWDELRTLWENQSSRASDARGALTAHDVHALFSSQSGVPAMLLRDDLPLSIAEVESALRARVVGQERAVRRVAEAVCVVKARLQPTGRPLATLLFIGPTGVGKTELSRALAELLFGSEERLLRFDMSEFTDLEAVDRLLRGTAGAEGLLTRRVREQPFSVLLLDEVEKAHPAVFDLLLQVLGEARLTDGRGRTAYFHNCIVIMTSNLGAATWRASMGFSQSDADVGSHYRREVERSFRPEFVNRLDRIVDFEPLALDDLRRVATIALDRVRQRRGLGGASLEVSPAALDALVAGGHSPRYGARAMRRHLEDALVAPLATLLSQSHPELPLRRARVTLPAEDEAPWAEATAEGALRVEAQRGGGESREWHEAEERLTLLRRFVDRAMTFERVEALASRLEQLRVELDYGQRAGDEGALERSERSQLQSEHHWLAGVVEALDGARHAVHAAEERVVVARLAGGPPVVSEGEVEALRAQARAALVGALTVGVPGRHRATLVVTELDGERALDEWLPDLLSLAVERGWSPEFHVYDDTTVKEGWPRERRWGPPRAAGEARYFTTMKQRDAMAAMVHLRGADAGLLMAMEAGLHRWRKWSGEGGRKHLHVRLAGTRGLLADAQWDTPGAAPVPPTLWDEVIKGQPARERLVDRDEVLVGARMVELRGRTYFGAIEELCLAQLLRFEVDGLEDREAWFIGALDVTATEAETE